MTEPKPDLAPTLGDKRLIFTVATGRCGTAYLAELLKFIPRADVFHEPEPEFADVMRSAQEDPGVAASFIREKKLPAIAALPAPVYIETSHLFCKGFLEPLHAAGLYPDIISLSRAPRDVALSMLTMGTIPGRSDKGLRFYLSPADPGVLPVASPDSLSDYQVCYWYCLEIARRTDEIEQFCAGRGLRFCRTTLPEITTRAGFLRLLAEMDLPRPTLFGWLQYARYGRNRVNESRETKKNVAIPDDLDGLEADVHERLAAARGS